jgi:hypothetical protein
MSWSLFRWVWRLEGPLHVGIPPSGSLDRCRLYVPDRNLWAALTAELAQRKMEESPKNLDIYRETGKDLRRSCRFSYLYPSEQSNGEWKAWLPCFEKGKGLCWRREVNLETLPDRAFRSRLLDTRPGTAIDPGTDSAAEGSLHETEVVNTLWRKTQGSWTGAVAMTGYLFCSDKNIFKDLGKVDVLHVGGDIRYGLGKMVRVEMEKAERLFNYDVRLDQDNPQVYTMVILAHLKASTKNYSTCGALERLGGWDVGKPRAMLDIPFWSPGSKLVDNEWLGIQDDGIWGTLANEAA